MRQRPAIALTVLVAVAAATPARIARADPGTRPEPVMLVIDTSGSMGDNDSGHPPIRKIDGAKLSLLNYAAQIEPGTPVGLRQFPQPGGQSCDSGLRVQPLRPVNVTALSGQIRALQPDGDTPTPEALRAAAGELATYSKKYGGDSGVIVLVSDGMSTCGDPCPEARSIAKKTGIDFQTITVGFRIDDAGRQQLKCIADALGGQYVDAQTAGDLSNAVREASSPDLHVALTNVSLHVVADDVVQIEADISNSAEVEARDVVARLRFDDLASPGVSRPVRRLGNLGPDVQSQHVTWTFRPSGSLLDNISSHQRVLSAHVDASADNSDVPAGQKLTITVTDAQSATDAGPILKGRKPAILGDSYSAGEGADDYIPGYATLENACHRSQKTYLFAALHLSDEQLRACSGAVINDIDVANAGNHEPPQREQLRDIMHTGIGAAVMTMGGNDVLFGPLVKSCVLYPTAPCNEQVITDFNPFNVVTKHSLLIFNQQNSTDFLDTTVGNDAWMLRLVDVYKELNGNLNNSESFKSRGGAAPILVPAYPIAIPLTGRSCGPMLDLLSAQEIDLLFTFATRLNEQVERAVRIAHGYGVPVFFIPTTETAFLPDHTICDGQPFARALNSFNGAVPMPDLTLLRPDWFLGLDLANRSVKLAPASIADLSAKTLSKAAAAAIALKYATAVFGQSAQELLHPNQAGYAAETRAILRWSNSAEARDDAASLKTYKAIPLLPTWSVSNTTIGQLAPGSVTQVQGGQAYPLQGTGFAPGSTVTISVHSTPTLLLTTRANSRGAFRVLVGMPRTIGSGRHDLYAIGPDRKGRPREIHFPIQVAARFKWTTAKMLAGVAAASLAMALLLATAASGLDWRSRRKKMLPAEV